jgi:hypothetical protein
MSLYAPYRQQGLKLAAAQAQAGKEANSVVNLPDANGNSIQYRYDSMKKTWIDANGAQVTDPDIIKLITSQSAGNKIGNAGNKVAGGINAFTRAFQQGAQNRERVGMPIGAGIFSNQNINVAGRNNMANTVDDGQPMSIKIGNITQQVDFDGSQWINKNSGKPIADPTIIKTLNAQRGLV